MIRANREGYVQCQRCNGDGVIYLGPDGGAERTETCRLCAGDGEIPAEVAEVVREIEREDAADEAAWRRAAIREYRSWKGDA